MRPLKGQRESEVYQLTGQGFTNKEIGEALGLAEKTVKVYITRLFIEHNVRNRVELALKFHGISAFFAVAQSPKRVEELSEMDSV